MRAKYTVPVVFVVAAVLSGACASGEKSSNRAASPAPTVQPKQDGRPSGPTPPPATTVDVQAPAPTAGDAGGAPPVVNRPAQTPGPDLRNDTVTPPRLRHPETPDSRPPAAWLGTPREETNGSEGSYCWNESPDASGLCAEKLPREPGYELRVQRGEMLDLSYTKNANPTEISANRSATLEDEGQSFTVPATNPSSFRADFEPGVWYLTFLSKWGQHRDVFHTFKIRVV